MVNKDVASQYVSVRNLMKGVGFYCGQENAKYTKFGMRSYYAMGKFLLWNCERRRRDPRAGAKL